MDGVTALRQLSALGYRFEVTGDRLKYRHDGPALPDPAQVMPLLAAVKAHKRAALDYLSAPAPPEHVQVCAECGAQRVETCPDFSPERTACEKNPAGAIGCQMQPAPAPTCSRCRVFELNPYTHYPDFDGWCWAEMDNAESTAPVCDAYYAGAVKDLRTGQVMDPRPQAPSKRRSLCYH